MLGIRLHRAQNGTFCPVILPKIEIRDAIQEPELRIICGIQSQKVIGGIGQFLPMTLLRRHLCKSNVGRWQLGIHFQRCMERFARRDEVALLGLHPA